MSRKNSKRSSRTRSNFPLHILSSAPSLLLKTGVSFLKFKSARRKGVQRFRKELLGSGLSEEQIESLTTQYEDIGRLRKYFNLFESFRGFG